VARQTKDNLIAEAIDYAPMILKSSRIQPAHDQATAKGVKEPKFDLKHVPLTLESALDQEFGTDVGPVFEIDGMLHETRSLRILKKTFTVEYLKETRKLYCFCQETRKHPAKLGVALPCAHALENRDRGWDFPQIRGVNIDVDTPMARSVRTGHQCDKEHKNYVQM